MVIFLLSLRNLSAVIIIIIFFIYMHYRIRIHDGRNYRTKWIRNDVAMELGRSTVLSGEDNK